ncbi:MAG: hypothetical protein LBK53_07470 [Heliobacteriaceae bacterium]|jgi:predicted DNA binding CopG/RHH family protein|nr:hypothetical protein [Heliobacteriaceae bacterium]
MKKYKKEELLKQIEVLPSDLTAEEEALFDQKIETAENHLVKMKSNGTVNFRWSEFEIHRAKKIAAKLGMPYQTYIKTVLEHAMNDYEQKFNQA